MQPPDGTCQTARSKYPAEQEALWRFGPLKGARPQPKAVNGYLYEHVHVNDHGFVDVDVDVDVLVLVDVFLKTKGEALPEM